MSQHNLTGESPDPILGPRPVVGEQFVVVYFHAIGKQGLSPIETWHTIHHVNGMKKEDGRELWVVEVIDPGGYSCLFDICYEVSKKRWREWDGDF